MFQVFCADFSTGFLSVPTPVKKVTYLVLTCIYFRLKANIAQVVNSQVYCWPGIESFGINKATVDEVIAYIQVCVCFSLNQILWLVSFLIAQTWQDRYCMLYFISYNVYSGVVAVHKSYWNTWNFLSFDILLEWFPSFPYLSLFRS